MSAKRKYSEDPTELNIDKVEVKEEISCSEDVCDIPEIAPDEPIAHGFSKNKLFRHEQIKDIFVNCPVYGEDHQLSPNDPELICPVCGDFHDLKDYTIVYQDGSSCTANAAVV